MPGSSFEAVSKLSRSCSEAVLFEAVEAVRNFPKLFETERLELFYSTPELLSKQSRAVPKLLFRSSRELFEAISDCIFELTRGNRELSEAASSCYKQSRAEIRTRNSLSSDSLVAPLFEVWLHLRACRALSELRCSAQSLQSKPNLNYRDLSCQFGSLYGFSGFLRGHGVISRFCLGNRALETVWRNTLKNQSLRP